MEKKCSGTLKVGAVLLVNDWMVSGYAVHGVRISHLFVVKGKLCSVMVT